jgi:ElaA protein
LSIDWRFAPFADLTPREVHDLYRLRVAVFIVEQDCVFQDVDGVDPQCWHLLGYADESGPGPRPEASRGDEAPRDRLVAYCRFVPPGVKYAEPSIGRVITAPRVRGSGMGRVLMREAMRRAQGLWPGERLRIGAQAHLERFYNEFGFTKASEPYDEDGILHIEMEMRQWQAS